MRHIRYLSDGTSLCADPDRLDAIGDFVTIDPSSDPEPACSVCGPLLAAHNKREYEREAYERIKPTREPNLMTDPSVDIFIGGAALASAFWITFFVILWAVWLRCA